MVSRGAFGGLAGNRSRLSLGLPWVGFFCHWNSVVQPATGYVALPPSNPYTGAPWDFGVVFLAIQTADGVFGGRRVATALFYSAPYRLPVTLTCRNRL